MNKAGLRGKYRSIRDAIPKELQNQKNSLIIQKIRSLPQYIKSRTIGIFYPLPNEVNLLALLSDLDKRFCFPKIIDFQNVYMEFCWHEDKFLPGRFGLSEPVGTIANKAEIDLLIVPGLVLSKEGYRIGYGKGFFDQYLSDFNGYTIGVGFQEQIIDHIPIENHDIRLQAILTDEEELCIQL